MIFDLYQKGFEWWFPASGLLFVFVGGVFIWLGRSKNWPRSRWFFAYFMIGFASLWSGVMFSSTFREYLALRSAYSHSQFSVVEGRVTDFRSMPYQGHQLECFSVHAHTFCYSDYFVTAGFNNSASHGGPIREGLPVRVSYIGNTIVRLEAAGNPPLSDAHNPTNHMMTPATSNAAKSDPLGLYGPENKDLADCLNRVNPGDPVGLRGETQAQAAARKACIDKYAR